MKKVFPKTLQNLIHQLSRLPGVGPKTAQRFSFYLLKWSRAERQEMAEAIAKLTEGITYCRECFNLAESNPCYICADAQRDRGTICVVEEPPDVLALETSSEYEGLYHVLGGSISPVNNVGPNDLKINELIRRIEKESEIKEVIIATNPDLEGEATAMYLVRLLKPLKIKITRIARGLPTGGDLEYADEVTLSNAITGRKEYQLERDF